MENNKTKKVKVAKVRLKKFENVEILIGQKLNNLLADNYSYFITRDLIYEINQEVPYPALCLWNKKIIIDNEIISKKEPYVMIDIDFNLSHDISEIDKIAQECKMKFFQYKLIFVIINFDMTNEGNYFDELNLYLYMSHHIQLLHVRTIQPDLCELIYRITKSISESHQKLKYYESKFAFHPDGESFKSIKLPVEVNNERLIEKWKQDVWKAQLCSFNNVTNDTAEAIVSNISSPNVLIDSYRSILSKHVEPQIAIKECQDLLKDINVRRGAGIIQNTRKVGPELSKKIHTFFTIKDPSCQL